MRPKLFEESMKELTPVEKIGDIWMKREDKFIPFVYSSANGSKLRQLGYLVSKALENPPYIKTIVHGCVTGSPQSIFAAAIAKYYGLSCINVVGTMDLEKHKNLKLAYEMGAEFVFCPVGYARTLEARARELALEDSKRFFFETNITVDHEKNPPGQVEAFHAVGAQQVANIPDHIETLLVPAGSCNSITSILYGVAKFRPRNLKKIVLFGIGNYGSKDPDYIRRRLNVIGMMAGIDFNEIFDYSFNSNKGLPFTFDSNERIVLQHYDLNGTGFCEYNDLMPYNYGGVEMHPRYEGKIFHYIDANRKEFQPVMNNKSLFWIVGSEPK